MWLRVVVLLLLASPDASATADELWRQLLANDPARVLRAPSEAGSPAAQLAVAFAWMQREPRTEGNLERARRILRDLSGGDPESVAGPPALIAEYLLGRIAHLYVHPGDRHTAAAHYRNVIDRGANSPWAQHVAVRYIMLQLAGAEDKATAHARWRMAADLIATFTEADAIRDGHLVLTHLGLYWEIDDNQILKHALAADRMTFHQIHNRDRLRLSIANIAARSGRPDLAREYYRKLIAEAPRDLRLNLVEDRLSTLETETTP